MTHKALINRVYSSLLEHYGLQKWWPLIITEPGGSSSSIKTLNDIQKLEICVGAILTQNTNWNNVEKALGALAKNDLFYIETLKQLPTKDLASAIRSAGYHHQKSTYIKNFLQFLEDNTFSDLQNKSTAAIRKKLLNIKGIGPETADCILVYALGRCSFVIDAYTRRIFESLKMVDQDIKYSELKTMFESSLANEIIVYQEYHALLVKHGKLFYSRKPYGINDRLLLDEQFKKGQL